MTDPALPRAASPFPGGAALAAREVSKYYRRGATAALDCVSIEIPPGRLTALVGPNGAGKSTLIRTWLGFEKPTDGDVSVLGLDPVRDPLRALASIGYVTQSGSLYRDLSVRDHMRLVASYRSGFDEGLAADRLATVRIPLRRPVRELSGGQQAQVALALALATCAPVLLLDEPVASLDPLARREFMRALVRIVRDDGRTVVLSSHVVADVEDASDRLVLLIAGRMVLDLDVSEVLRSHAGLPAWSDSHAAVAKVPGVRGDDRLIVRAEPRIVEERVTLEDVVMAYLIAARASA